MLVYIIYACPSLYLACYLFHPVMLPLKHLLLDPGLSRVIDLPSSTVYTCTCTRTRSTKFNLKGFGNWFNRIKIDVVAEHHEKNMICWVTFPDK